jgi:ParB family chromosome partitioning protein
MMKKVQSKGLGKGLDALISSSNTLEDEQNSVLNLKITDIEPSAQQPRKLFDQEKLQNLSDSIQLHGVVQPIIVRKEGMHYIIVAGERRWRASKLAGLKSIPAIVKEYSSRQVMEIALIENIQREDLNPIEEAEAFRNLVDDYDMTQEELAKVVGKSRSAVTNSLRLLSLSDPVQAMLVDGRLSSGHARTLVPIQDTARQEELANLIISKGLNVRAAEQLVIKEEKRASEIPILAKKKEIEAQLQLDDLTEQIGSIFGTKVEVSGTVEKGKISLNYFSRGEFENIVEILLKISK